MEYGRCPCSGTYQERLVLVPLGGSSTLENVPQGACRMCGARVYKADILEMLEGLLRAARESHSDAP